MWSTHPCWARTLILGLKLTWGKVSSKSSYRLTDELQVRKGEGERTKMDWTPKKSL